MREGDGGVSVQKKWRKLGFIIAVLHYAFLLAVLLLLEVDLYLAMAVAVTVSIVSGVALTLFVLYVYR